MVWCGVTVPACSPRRSCTRAANPQHVSIAASTRRHDVDDPALDV
jgi:hypothetical protein